MSLEREKAFNLLCEYTLTDPLRKHALAVEAAMRAYAKKFGEDEERWGAVGLLHDFDYEKFPQYPEHPMKGSEILKDRGYDDEFRTAILGHVPATHVARTTQMAKALFACDELCGFVMAAALIRPAKIADLGASSVKKKLKDKAFARAVSREDIAAGVAELGVPMDEHIQTVIDAMRSVASGLGLA